MAKSKILFTLIVGSVLSFSAQAKMYKWVDDKGVTHYGETIPAEYANKDRSELNKAGRIISTTDVLTPEEHRAKESADAKHKADLEIERNLKLHDNSLLNTYSNVKEIDQARARNVQQIDARAQAATRQLIEANKNLDGLQKLALAKSAGGKPVPQDITQDIQTAQTLVNKLNKDLSVVNGEKTALEARYDADKARYQALTGR